MGRRVICLVALAASVLAATTPLAAQDESEASVARTLFNEGRAAAQAHEWSVAVERFRQTLALRDTPAVRYSYGVALIEAGQLLAGIEHLERAASNATFAVAASDLIEASRARLARLVVDVGASSNRRVELDGAPLPSELIGSEVPADPGQHTVRLLTADGEVGAEVSITLSDGEVRRVVLSPNGASAELGVVGDDGPRARDDGAAIALATSAGVLTLTAVGLTVAAAWSWSDTEQGIRTYGTTPTSVTYSEANARADRTDQLVGFATGTLVGAAALWSVAAAILVSAQDTAPGAALEVGPTGVGVRARW